MGIRHLLLISISGESPLLPRDGDLFSDCSELPLGFLSTRVLQFHTTHTRFQLPLGLTFRQELERRLKRLGPSVGRICLRREFRDGLSVYPGISPRLFVLRVEMSIGGDVRPYDSNERANEYIRSYMKHHS